jgi:preprotein translocase subunit YajC
VFTLLVLAQQGGSGGGSLLGSPIVMMVLMFGVVYFMMIRPQQKKASQHQEWLKGLKKGDEVVTQGGIIGRISGLTDQVVFLELQDKVRVRVLRTSITGKPPEVKRAAPATDEKTEPAEEKK